MNIRKESELIKKGAWDVIDHKCRTGHCFDKQRLMKYGYKQYAAEVLSMPNQEIVDYARALGARHNPKGYAANKREYVTLIAMKIDEHRDTLWGRIKRVFNRKI